MSDPVYVWEYESIVTKTQHELVTRLNQMGREGWELVSVVRQNTFQGVTRVDGLLAVLKRDRRAPGRVRFGSGERG